MKPMINGKEFAECATRRLSWVNLEIKILGYDMLGGSVAGLFLNDCIWIREYLMNITIIIYFLNHDRYLCIWCSIQSCLLIQQTFYKRVYFKNKEKNELTDILLFFYGTGKQAR